MAILANFQPTILFCQRLTPTPLRQILYHRHLHPKSRPTFAAYIRQAPSNKYIIALIRSPLHSPENARQAKCQLCRPDFSESPEGRAVCQRRKNPGVRYIGIWPDL